MNPKPRAVRICSFVAVLALCTALLASTGPVTAPQVNSSAPVAAKEPPGPVILTPAVALAVAVSARAAAVVAVPLAVLVAANEGAFGARVSEPAVERPVYAAAFDH